MTTTSTTTTSCGTNNNSIPPNIHIIRTAQKGLQLLQAGGAQDPNISSSGCGSGSGSGSGNGRELVDCEAEIIPTSATKVCYTATTPLLTSCHDMCCCCYV
jgi:hypothetical protein